jgi:hypothetical protein
MSSNKKNFYECKQKKINKCSRGSIGSPGTMGDPGEPGGRGDRGPLGPKGCRGPQGIKGDRGSIGGPGDQGIKGDKGSRGDIGYPGTMGTMGDIGDIGPIGPTGPQGQVGPTGPTSNDTILSDIRSKKEISDCDIGADLLMQLETKKYIYKKSKEGSLYRYGLIAQQVEQIINDNKIERFGPIQYNKMEDEYGIRYTDFITILIKGFQELNTKIVKLEQHIKKQDDDITQLYDKIETLEK